MKKQLQFIVFTILMVSVGLTGYGQNVGDIFYNPNNINGIGYGITNINPNEVEIFGHPANINPDNIIRVLNIPPTVTRPGTNERYDVTHISTQAFMGDFGLDEVTIPNTVRSIGSHAFAGLEGGRAGTLKSVVIPNSVENMEAGVFSFSGLETVTIGQGLTRIENGTFNLTKLTSVEIPDNVIEIGVWAFGNSELSNITIGQGVTGIEDSAFKNNKKLTNVEIPDNVTTIGPSAFAIDEELGKGELASVTIGQGVTSIGANAFENGKLTEVALPNSVTSIGNWAFWKNHLASVTFTSPSNVTRIEHATFAFNQLTEVTIPNSVTSIGAEAFNGNPLATVVLKPTVPPSIQASTFTNNRQNINVIVPKGAYNNYEPWKSFGFKSIREKVDIGDTFTAEGIKYQVTALGTPNEAMIMDYESALPRVNIPGTVSNGGHDFEVTKIEDFAFADKQLNGVTIGQNVTSIGESAFQRNNLTSVDIPNSVTSIGFSAFQRNNLTSVDIPGSVIRIGVGAFNSNHLTRVNIQSGVESIQRDAFSDNPDLATVVSTGHTPPLIKGGPEDPFTNADRGQIDLIVPVGRITDYENAGWTGFASTSEGIGLSIDIEGSPAEITDISPFKVTFTFGSGVTGFTMDDIDLDNASADNFISVSGTEYTVDIKPELCNGIIRISVPIDVVAPINNLPASVGVRVNAVQEPEVSSPLVEYCVGDNAIALTATGTSLLWYTTETGGTGSATAPVPDTATAGDTSYYVSQTNNDSECESERTLIVVRVNPQLVTPTLSSNTPICSGEDALFTITGTPGDLVTYSGALSGTAIIEASGEVDVTVNGAGSDMALELTQVSNGGCSMPLTGTTATVIVQGDRVIAVAQDMTVRLDADGQATITPAQVNRSSRGGCNNSDSLFLNLDKTTFSCDDVGTPVMVALTAIQGNETATATALVTVEAYVNNLVAKAKDWIVQLDTNGEATISPEDIDDGSSYDGCGSTPELGLDIDTFDCDDVGNPVTVTLTAAHGTNTATATATVTVEANGNCGLGPLADFNRGFSPNGDGIADTLVIEGLEHYRNNVVMIYDLSQRLLFSAHYGGPGDAWDGTQRGGDRVPVGSYVCVIDYNEPGLGHEAKMIYVNY